MLNQTHLNKFNNIFMLNNSLIQLNLKKLIIAAIALMISIFMFGALFFSGPQQLAATGAEKQTNMTWWSWYPRWIWR